MWVISQGCPQWESVIAGLKGIISVNVLQRNTIKYTYAWEKERQKHFKESLNWGGDLASLKSIGQASRPETQAGADDASVLRQDFCFSQKPQFRLLRPSTDWTRPAHIAEIIRHFPSFSQVAFHRVILPAAMDDHVLFPIPSAIPTSPIFKYFPL